MDADRARPLLDRLVDELKVGDEGDLTDPIWESVFRRVPRHLFLAGFHVDTHDPSSHYQYVDPLRDPDRWMQLVYSDESLVTRVGRYERPLSSSSMPRMVARFLQLLDVRDGNRVLEIGTGTGYSAALLCERLGPRNVSSIDIDPPLVASARTALARCGHDPVLAVADGLGGYPERAPYDRIVSTASATRIPVAWVDQLRPGGVIVTPLTAPMSGGLVALRGQPDGSLQGRLDPRGARFMALRSEAEDYAADPQWPELLELIWEPEGDEIRPCTLPEWLDDPWEPDVHVMRLVQLSARDDLEWFWFPGPKGPRTLPAIVARGDRSWMRVEVAEEGTTTVRQGGPRRLWDLLTQTEELWVRLGRPTTERYGLTVRPDGSQLVWLDDPESDHRWEL